MPTNTPQDQQHIARIIAYHHSSKHDFGHYAPGPQGLDWANQPDPFRRYDGTPLFALQHPEPTQSPSYGEVTREGGLPAAPFDHATISRLLYHSLALSAWKQAGGTRWALRVNPSSGNLHPTEAYLLLPTMSGLAAQPAVYHYAPKQHALEQRCSLDAETWEALQTRLGDGNGVLLVLSSIYWREAWKYGQRAYRYCQHDIGHAIAASSIAAAGLGWRLRLLDGWSHAQLAELAGLAGPTGKSGDEIEYPDCLLAISADDSRPTPSAPDDALLTRLQQLNWCGSTNRLSPDHRHWELLQQAIVTTPKPATDGLYPAPNAATVAATNEATGPPLGQLLHRRRSAVAMDGHSGITRAAFFQILSKLLPGASQLPFSALPWSPQVNLLLFVHRVEELDPGLYLLLRDPQQQTALSAQMRTEFEWQPVGDAPDALWRLATGDARPLARQLSCDQAIAADGCFAVAMLSNFRQPIRQYGAWFYPRLFWECGLIGQRLYLEATASGIAATGIGCFFDDPVHKLLGLHDDQFQVLYHFTVGAAVEDTRLSTLPAYPDRPTAA